MSLVNRETGELADLESIQARALDYVLLEDEIRHDRADLDDKAKRLRGIAAELLEVLAQGQAIETGPAAVVRVPPRRPSQRVSRSGCERWSEQLLALGIGRVAYEPPGIEEIRRNSARIIAAGIELEAVAPTPMPGDDRLEVVPR